MVCKNQLRTGTEGNIMAEHYARNNEELSSFIANASAGDTIYLAGGTYNTVWIKSQGTLDIKIASLDESDPAILTGLRMSGSSGVTFEGLVFSAPAGVLHSFLVTGADDVHFSNIVMHGPDNMGSGAEVTPFFIRSSTNVSVTGSEFYDVKNALMLLDIDGIEISGNSFHDIRCDGVAGGGVSNALITNNVFTDFYPLNTGGSGDHPDAIQFWSNNQDEPGRNITISDNLIYRGNGLPMQGIFIRDTYSEMPFEDLTISGNVVLGGLYNAISVGGVNGGQLVDNIVIGMDGQKSWIRVSADTDFVIEDNFASHYSAYNRDTPYDASNLTIPGGTLIVNEALRTWIASGSSLIGDLQDILVGDYRPQVSEPVDTAPLPIIVVEPTETSAPEAGSSGDDAPATDPVETPTSEVQPEAPAPSEPAPAPIPAPAPAPTGTEDPTPVVSIVETELSITPAPGDAPTAPEVIPDVPAVPATAEPEVAPAPQEEQPEAPVPSEPAPAPVPAPAPAPTGTESPTPVVSIVETDLSIDPATGDAPTAPEVPAVPVAAEPEVAPAPQEPTRGNGSQAFIDRFLARFGDDVPLDFGPASNPGSSRLFGHAHRAGPSEAVGITLQGQNIMLDEMLNLHANQATQGSGRGLGRIDQIFSSVQAHGAVDARPAPTAIDTIFQTSEPTHLADNAGSTSRFADTGFVGFGLSGRGELTHLGMTPEIV